ncbi:PREDICTED: uncharacterized protein LOC106102814 [Papilio polytes]|uniref:uncharacterized protein LOC106102814 n=1 Tax=Papilio polytes TaxID=76194 RepID=UPI000676191F|nr:PREDICTED: uncharacterized protein LOC106102814 [Papilio polytes]
MGNSCSSGQAHRDKDNISQHSEEPNCCARRSPSYRTTKIAQEPEPAAEPPLELLEPAPSLREKKPSVKVPRPVASSVSVNAGTDSISLSSPVACASPREEVVGPPVPASVAALPEELRCYLLGKAPPIRNRRRRAMLIYVCAADSQDCCAEKGILQCAVAAKLRVRARRRGWRVHVSDLHWRSPLEQQRDHRFPVLCIVELTRQSELGAVVPVLFLNSGLGTPLLPHTLECADFKAALEAAEDENDQALLNKCYSYAISCRIYATITCHLSERNVIRASVRGRGGAGAGAASGAGAGAGAGACIGAGDEECSEQVRAALADRLGALLDTLVADNEQPAGSCGVPTSLFDEISEHLSFCQKAAQCTSNREITLNDLKTYVTGESSVPLALLGGAGCGKATLLARAASLAHTWLPDLALIVRFVGLTSQSSSSHQLLKSIVDQCHVLHTGTVYRGRNVYSK